MNQPLFYPLPGNDAMAQALAAGCGGETGDLEMRNFPDGESYLRFRTDPGGRNVVLVCSLDHPNPKFLPLFFAAAAARDLGAHRVGLVAPYLSYMRQDRRFQPGEAVTSRHFAALVSRSVDWLATIDPHLHRYKSLGALYGIPARVIHAGDAIAAWIKANVDTPFIIGPDEESEQWVSQIAHACGAGYAVLHKQRLGDRDVRIAPDKLAGIGSATPVLVDDIISSGETMLEALRVTAPHVHRRPIVIAVHGIFADGVDTRITDQGVRLITTNTIAHQSNGIDITACLIPAIQSLD